MNTWIWKFPWEFAHRISTATGVLNVAIILARTPRIGTRIDRSADSIASTPRFYACTSFEYIIGARIFESEVSQELYDWQIYLDTGWNSFDRCSRFFFGIDVSRDDYDRRFFFFLIWTFRRFGFNLTRWMGEYIYIYFFEKFYLLTNDLAND